jgi:2',3'-cyclic-nucleotide 2'-phosphodiesterase (5'-nucleotidase family)
VRLLHYSDVENAHDDPETIGRVAGCIQSLDGADALVCGTGDNTSPGVLPLVTRGEQALDFFAAISPGLSTFGNHDFDYGADRTREIVERSPQEWLSANIYEDGDRFAGVPPSTVRTVDGTRIGFFGVTDPTVPSATESARALTFTDPIAEAEHAVETLRDRGVDHVVALSHLGRADDRLAAACDIDVILGGHVHTERIERVAGTLITRPGSGGGIILEINLEERSVTRHVVADATPDADLVETYRRRLESAGLDEVVGHVEEPIERTERDAFRGESRVGNFVADAYRWAAERELGTDPPVVGLQNSGGIRTGPPLSGDVTVGDLIGLVPFEEPLAAVELSGAELLDVFREAADTTGFGEADWWHAHVSGAHLAYDYTKDSLVEATVHGDPIDVERRYRLAISEFILHTGVEFPTLTEDAVISRYETQYDVLIEYARTVGIATKLEGRIVRTGL